MWPFSKKPVEPEQDAGLKYLNQTKTTEEEAAKTRAKAIAENLDKCEKKMVKFETEDEKDHEAAKWWGPDVRIIQYFDEFLCYGNTEVPRKYIENITVLHAGEAPTIITKLVYLDATDLGQSFVASTAVPAESAIIEISMTSGMIHKIECSRHHVDHLLDALRDEWKNGKAQEPEPDETQATKGGM